MTKRNEVIQVRVSAEEKAEWEKLASTRGLSLSGLIRALVVGLKYEAAPAPAYISPPPDCIVTVKPGGKSGRKETRIAGKVVKVECAHETLDFGISGNAVCPICQKWVSKPK